MLRDSQGFETKIIDAVRSVNRALGGATGSTADRRSDYNQYEVQLIEAIRAIGRTLSGKGLSVAGGVAGDASGFATVQQFQDLSRRVTKLEDESFFRLVDGNVTLKEEYQNLWVPGFLSSGGVGTSGGGGSATELGDLVDVSLSSRADGDLLVYNSLTSHWENKPQSSIIPSVSIGFGDLTSHPNTISGYGITDAYISGGTIHIGGNTLTPVTDIPALYALGTRVTDAPGLGILLGVSVMSANLATSASGDTSRVQWDHVNDAWHFYGNVYVDGFLASGGIGGGGGGGGYGVERITTNQDGTVDFHFTGGGVTTVDLNHEHPQYPKYVVCTQAEYDALTTKDSDTLYLIPATV